MDKDTNPYKIVLPKGKAVKPFMELTPEEVHELGRKIFERVKRRAKKAGVVPVTTETLKTRHNNS